ncbi:nibrin isoform X2 [Rhynchophorus ferrugineus]|uniref:nibrin isoform X2 n=1 Tax=Rhynchophorus ferrugineus TaxID=354439 RepID=UPI003FCEC082
MLYFLKNNSTGTEIILEKKDYSIGRKDCDIILENDQSISRRHAYIRIKSDNVTLEDVGSKYHTFHNSVELKAKTEVTLNHKDTIKFGILNNLYTFEAYKFIVTTSGLSGNKKSVLKNNVEYCGGKFSDKWSPYCTHLVVEEITLTIKFLQALINEVIIITPEYWVAYKQSLDSNSSMPDITKYNSPKVSEQLLKSDFQCTKNPMRRTLFKNKVFVFYKTSFKEQMQDVIEHCEGKCFAWEEEEKSFTEMSTSSKEYLIIKADDASDSFNNIIKKYEDENKRAIPLNEIALAITNCSCQKFCNPSFNKAKEIFAKETEKFQNEDVLVKDTQTQLSNVCKDKEMNRHGGLKRINKDAPEKASKKTKIQTTSEEIKNIPDMFKQIEHNIKIEKIEEQPQHSSKKTVTDISQKKINPFAIVKQGTSKKRTLTSVDGSQNDTNEHSKKLKVTNQENVYPFELKATQKKISVIQSKSSKPDTNESVYNCNVSKSIITGTWISKNTTIKCETSKIEDRELKEISDAFRNCVHIKQLPLSFCDNIEQKSERIDDYLWTSSNNGIKNYKKFRKVTPLKPQIHFISRNTLTKVCANSHGGGSSLDIKSDSEDDIKEKPKQKFKTFIFEN